LSTLKIDQTSAVRVVRRRLEALIFQVWEWLDRTTDDAILLGSSVLNVCTNEIDVYMVSGRQRGDPYIRQAFQVARASDHSKAQR
jgi:hypothetical protein